MENKYNNYNMICHFTNYTKLLFSKFVDGEMMRHEYEPLKLTKLSIFSLQKYNYFGSTAQKKQEKIIRNQDSYQKYSPAGICKLDSNQTIHQRLSLINKNTKHNWRIHMPVQTIYIAIADLKIWKILTALNRACRHGRSVATLPPIQQSEAFCIKLGAQLKQNLKGKKLGGECMHSITVFSASLFPLSFCLWCDPGIIIVRVE